MPDRGNRMVRIMMRQRIFIWCMALLAVGALLFYFSLANGHDFGREGLGLLGTALVNTGAISLIFEFINLRKLVNEDIVEALLSDERYLSSLREDELVRQTNRFIRARYPHADDVGEATVGWLLSTISAPARRSYLLRVRRHGETDPVLDLDVQISYQTARNRSRRRVLINGDGVIDTLFKIIPENTEFARRCRGDSRLSDAELYDLACEMFRPTVEISTDGIRRWHSIRPEIERVGLMNGANDRLAIFLDITSDYELEPSEQASVRYTHRQLSSVNDAYVWSASALTNDFEMRLLGFDGYALIPIANPTAKSNIQSLDISDDTIRCSGTILPQSSFAFSWSPEAPGTGTATRHEAGSDAAGVPPPHGENNRARPLINRITSRNPLRSP